MAGVINPSKVTAIEYPQWDASDLPKSLWKWYEVTVNSTTSTIAWYQRNKEPMRKGSRFFRGAAIVFTTMGTIVPLLSASGLWDLIFSQASSSKSQANALGQWGYVLLALAGACIGADKYFGFSSGWMRFMKAQMALETALAELRYDWTIAVAKLPSNALTSEQVAPLLQRLKDFAAKVNSLILQETDAWVLEFQSSLAELDKAAKAQAEAAKPGSIAVTVTNDSAFDPDIKVTLNGTEEKTLEGSKCLFRSVAPGVHHVLVRAKKGPKSVEKAEVTKVSADSAASISITLPS